MKLKKRNLKIAYAPPFLALLARIDAHLERRPPTPYRQAVLQVRARVEAARRGETAPPALPVDPVGTVSIVAEPRELAVGSAAPDFLIGVRLLLPAARGPVSGDFTS